jgi:hypothetical protein
MKVKVTISHIQQGVKLRQTHCPIALAIKEQYDFSYVSVGSIAAHLYEGSIRTECELPAEVQRFVKDFDTDKPVQPMEFELCKSELQPSISDAARKTTAVNVQLP